MCFEDNARPPALPFPMAGGAGDRRSLILEAADGNRFRAFAARALGTPAGTVPANVVGGPAEEAPRIPAGTGIVVLPDVRGLVPYYEELAVRFAQAGVHAVAVDLYARTAGTGEHGSDFDGGEHASRTTQKGIAADVAAAVRFLRSAEMGVEGALFTVGFCFGGRRSLLQGVEPHGLAGVIGFYGYPTEDVPDSPAPAGLADRFRCPVLALYGGADEAIPPEAIEAFDRALEAAGIDHESVAYPGAPHSFFDRMQDRYAEASADAWRRVLSFVSRHAGAAAA